MQVVENAETQPQAKLLNWYRVLQADTDIYQLSLRICVSLHRYSAYAFKPKVWRTFHEIKVTQFSKKIMVTETGLAR